MSLANAHKIVSIRELTDTVYVLRVEREGLCFEAGQHVTLGLHGSGINREYSIYSNEEAPFLEFLLKVRPASVTGRSIRGASPGDTVDIAGPYGEFLLQSPLDESARHLFIATGVGIAPFHSLVSTHRTITYQLIHGVSEPTDTYDSDAYAADCYVSCVSGGHGGDFSGRVTEFLEDMAIETGTHCYICGNSRMIAEVFDQLRKKGVPSDNILTEVFT